MGVKKWRLVTLWNYITSQLHHNYSLTERLLITTKLCHPNHNSTTNHHQPPHNHIKNIQYPDCNIGKAATPINKTLNLVPNKFQDSVSMEVESLPEIQTESATTSKPVKDVIEQEDNTAAEEANKTILEKEAFALLWGRYEKPNSEIRNLAVPITTLPAILGRTSQNTDNEHIFDLGDCKQLSRKHAQIFYADPYGGSLGRWKKEETPSDISIDDEWIYRKPETKSEKAWTKKKGSVPPREGFYAIECLSKNKVYVDGNRVDQGKMAVLNHGSTIKMLTFTLYFLLPEGHENNPRMVSVPHPMAEAEDIESNSESPTKKVKKENDDDQTLSDLILEFLTAVETDKFERKHSMISTSILHHAVQDVAVDDEIRKASAEEDGVSRTVIMDWIADSDVYGKYVKALLTKLEMKSYQQNLSKALVKGDYTRLGTTGRHVKWLLPGQKEGEGTKDITSGDTPKPPDEKPETDVSSPASPPKINPSSMPSVSSPSTDRKPEGDNGPVISESLTPAVNDQDVEMNSPMSVEDKETSKESNEEDKETSKESNEVEDKESNEDDKETSKESNEDDKETSKESNEDDKETSKESNEENHSVPNPSTEIAGSNSVGLNADLNDTQYPKAKEDQIDDSKP